MYFLYIISHHHKKILILSIYLHLAIYTVDKLKEKNKKIEYETGITSEVYTIKSNMRILDILNIIIQKKSLAIFEWVKKLEKDHEIKINDVKIVGGYLTGLGIAKMLNNKYNVTVIDIYPHIEKLIDNYEINALPEDIENGEKEKHNPNKENNKINFSQDLSLLNGSDLIIDTTGLGGISPEQSSKITTKAFLIEDPVAEDNDILIKNKNNINERLININSENKAILKTKGLNTKTSGTMTFTIDVLSKSIAECIKKEGVLYSVAEMTFFEEIIFKKKNLKMFFEIINSEALTVSTIKFFNVDEVINSYLSEINSSIQIK